jgi:APA family basic amino acid/polyamine antiporter
VQTEKYYKLNGKTASAFVIANMIGTGVFTSLGFQLLSTTNATSIALIWLIGGITALCGALVYSELGVTMPRSGGEYNFLSKIYHPAFGFLSGWVSLVVGFAAPVALACMALSSYVCRIYPALDPTFLAVSVLTIITVVHFYSIHMGSKMQNILTIAKILTIIIFIVAGLLCPADGAANFGPGNGFELDDVFSVGFGVSLIWVYYAYSGWNAAAYIVGDIKNPQRSMPFVLVLSTAFVVVLYLALNMIFLRTAPVAELSGNVEVGLISANHIFGHEGGVIMGLLIAMMLTSSISSMVYVGPRVSMTMGEDYRLFKFLKWRNRRNCPSVAVALQWLISMLMILTGSFKEVTEYTGIVLSFCSMLTVAGVFVHRRRFPDVKRSYKTIGYPVTPIIFCVVILASIVYLIYEDLNKTFVTHAQSAPWTTIASSLTLLIGLLLWVVAERYNKGYKDEADNIQNNQ